MKFAPLQAAKRVAKKISWATVILLVILALAIYMFVRWNAQRKAYLQWEMFEDAKAAAASDTLAKKHPMLAKWSSHVDDILKKKEAEKADAPKAPKA